VKIATPRTARPRPGLGLAMRVRVQERPCRGCGVVVKMQPNQVWCARCSPTTRYRGRCLDAGGEKGTP
jgi:Zn finger protein HypA/HybF involved in hydrogenase expression